MKKYFISLLFAYITNTSFCQKNNDTTLIRLLLEKESATWRSGDLKAHASCWKIQPYSKITVYTLDNKVIDVPPSFIINPPKDIAGKGGFSKNTNYRYCINKNIAWVSHNEESELPDGSINYSFENRILEKFNDQWKLVSQTIHNYIPSRGIKL